MLTFKTIVPAIRNYLKQNIQANVEQGKYGEMPSLLPAVWIYIEPMRNAATNYNNMPIIRQAKVTIFAIADAGLDKTEAMYKSVELIEDIEGILFSEEFENYLKQHPDNVFNNINVYSYADTEEPLGFDGIHSDYAVAYLELIFQYVKKDLVYKYTKEG